MNKTGILIQARLSSSRLPGKMLMNIADYKLVEFVYNRCMTSKKSDMCSIITSSDKSDDELADFCVSKGINVYRGDLNNVLQRYVDASNHYGIDNVIRVCGDSPFVDTNYIDTMLTLYETHSLDYIALNKNTIIHGLDAEIIKNSLLQSLPNETLEDEDREHVTLFIKKNLKRYKHMHIDSHFTSEEIEKARLTVDHLYDLEFCNRIYTKYMHEYGFDFTLSTIAQAIRKEIITCAE